MKFSKIANGLIFSKCIYIYIACSSKLQRVVRVREWQHLESISFFIQSFCNTVLYTKLVLKKKGPSDMYMCKFYGVKYCMFKVNHIV